MLSSPAFQEKTFFSHIINFVKDHKLLLIILGLFSLSIVYVNPLRETAMEDDWAYSLTVKNFIESGSYILNDWASANPLFQALWGSLLAFIFGFSFSILRISTLGLVIGGLVAFYGLAKEHGLTNTQAALLVFCFISSPLVFRFSFNFMTDMPFVALLVIAMFLYTRAIRLHNYPVMFAGSIAASACILTRQFGIAIVAGLFFIWLLEKNRVKEIPFFLTGLVLPVLGTLWQIYNVVVFTNPAAKYNQIHQAAFFADPVKFLGQVFIIKPDIIIQYLAFFTIPVLFLGLLNFFSSLRLEKSSSAKINPKKVISKITIFLSITAFVLFAMLIWTATQSFPALMPYLPWNFGLLSSNPYISLLVTLITIGGAIFFIYIFYRNYVVEKLWKKTPLNRLVLELVTLFLFLLTLVYFHFGDEYLLGFIPFGLITAGVYLKEPLQRFRVPVFVLCTLILLVSATLTRGLLAREEAYWHGAEFIREQGVATDQIYSTWTWVSYYSFDDFINQSTTPYLDIEGLFYWWLPARQKQAAYWITENATPPPGEKWQVLAEFSYQDFLLQDRKLYAIKRSFMAFRPVG
jgi:4-amino-4-deoxy-L-arabinose transferase-like glycosyltransferase